ncbi:MAG: nucleotidyltransferase family protein [Porticoccaceae bacterium]
MIIIEVAVGADEAIAGCAFGLSGLRGGGQKPPWVSPNMPGHGTMNARIEHRPATMVWDRVEQARDNLAELCRRHAVHRLSLFGSATGPEFDPTHSDLDFFVEFRELAPSAYAEAYFALWEDLQRLFGRPVDLLTESALGNPYLRNAVEQSRIELYAA